jgi:ABC-2 type transport system ATP-binding protein
LTLAPDGSLEVTGLPAAEINRRAAAGGLPLDELSTHTGSLEDVFLGLVGQGGRNSRV